MFMIQSNKTILVDDMSKFVDHYAEQQNVELPEMIKEFFVKSLLCDLITNDYSTSKLATKLNKLLKTYKLTAGV